MTPTQESTRGPVRTKRLRRWWVIGFTCMALLWLFWPVHLSEEPLSTVLMDQSGALMDARIASDGQWRFPHSEEVPEKFEMALLTYEDRWFHWHPGFNPVSMYNAFRENSRSGEIRRGGSTITMQLVRLNRKGQPRTYREKWIELMTAIRLTCQFRKRSILKEYVSRAPFGGNVVGLEAATWRYYGKPPHLLSWGEAATLAVLPNSPALIHPGRNRDRLRQKRDALLDRMVRQGNLTEHTAEMARLEPIPEIPLALPRRAPELATTLGQKTNGRIPTTLDGRLQDAARAIMLRHHDQLSGNGIDNQAVLIIRNSDHHVLVYAGNSPAAGIRGGDVDIIQAPRSPGSTLKPLLFACALDDGLIWPGTLIPDIPTQYGSYRPENYNRQFEGIVPAEQALASSLNIPMVRLLRSFGVDPFLKKLQGFGLNTLDRSAEHYGLSLILGGGEVTLWQLVQVYAAVAHELNRSTDAPPATKNLLQVESRQEVKGQIELPGRGAIWHMVEAMRLPDRPTGQENWTYFQSSRMIAWKTGTSFGFKDAWAIGVTPEYTIGVWVGNADAQPRPDLMGLKAAAPVLFDLFDLLPETTWFSPPLDDLDYAATCKFSGQPPGPFCPRDTVLVPVRSRQPAPCPYHQEILLDPVTGNRINSSCSSLHLAQQKTFAVLPPLQGHYYQLHHPEYGTLPPLDPRCQESTDLCPIQWIYPAEFTRMVLPVDLDGQRQSILLSATHRDDQAVIHWHMDEKFLGTTKQVHTMTVQPPPGLHTLTLLDGSGNRTVQQIEIQE
ncbi:MAG: penicillin-binding protein 1C [Saprospiraceae bacterium]|nr:penicillin-binding protein 1C [Saprospiraceae bacterium]